jgi:hypothetical protein
MIDIEEAAIGRLQPNCKTPVFASNRFKLSNKLPER